MARIIMTVVFDDVTDIGAVEKFNRGDVEGGLQVFTEACTNSLSLLGEPELVMSNMIIDEGDGEEE